VTDAELLAAYEPILRCTRGELFFPYDAERYITECDLWMGRSERDSELVVPYGHLTPERLAEIEAPAGQRLFLRLVQRPLTGVELARWRVRPDRPSFESAGRLARVGLFARIVDAAFNVSLLLRGTVPGGTAAAAWEKYRRLHVGDARSVYYGRVVRQDGWIVLQYLFFYFMNDWRSTFGGANDHEADWEQAFVFLEDRPERPRPVWCAAAAHDHAGDHLRRRWDDPELVRVGDHPVLFVGAGSHATYFEAGEYVTGAPLPGMRPVRGFLDAVRFLWRDVLRQDDPGDLGAKLEDWLSVPFIDYARGDGLSIGPGQETEWSVMAIDDTTPWVSRYRGLFGLDTYDRFAGERAPAGPRFTRSGTVRQSWHDPLGWAGLAKVAPPGRAPVILRERLAEFSTQLTELRELELEQAMPLPPHELERGGLERGAVPEHIRQAGASEVDRLQRELAETRRAIAEVEDRMQAAARELARVEEGDLGEPRAHLAGARRPLPPEVTRYGALVELWSALGVSLLLLAVVGLIFFTDVPGWGAVLLAFGVYVVLESAFRRQIISLLLRITLMLAVVGAAILVVEFIVELLILAIVGVALLTIADNVRELRRR
jgi:hypothetical protein